MEKPNEYYFIGQKIKELRKSQKLTQTDLAALVGVQKTSISKYESGSVKIPVYMLIRISNALDTSIEYLVGITEEASSINSIDTFFKYIDNETDYVISKIDLKHNNTYSLYNKENPLVWHSLTKNEVLSLQRSCSNYLKFKLNEIISEKKE